MAPSEHEWERQRERFEARAPDGGVQFGAHVPGIDRVFSSPPHLIDSLDHNGSWIDAMAALTAGRRPFVRLDPGEDGCRGRCRSCRRHASRLRRAGRRVRGRLLRRGPGRVHPAERAITELIADTVGLDDIAIDVQGWVQPLGLWNAARELEVEETLQRLSASCCSE